MGNTKVEMSILLLIGAFLFLQFKPVNKNTEIQYQQNMSHLREKEAQKQFSYIQEQIENHLDWYNKISEQTFNKQALILPSDRDPLDVTIRRCEALIADLKESTDLSVLENEFTTLKNKANQTPLKHKKERKKLFLKLVDLRRKISFSNPLLDFNDIIFTASYSSAGDFHMCDQYYGVFARPGGSILKLTMHLALIPL